MNWLLLRTRARGRNKTRATVPLLTSSYLNAQTKMILQVVVLRRWSVFAMDFRLNWEYLKSPYIPCSQCFNCTHILYVCVGFPECMGYHKGGAMEMITFTVVVVPVKFYRHNPFLPQQLDSSPESTFGCRIRYQPKTTVSRHWSS